MDWNEIIGYILTALGGGAVTQVINWKINKKKATVEVKASEVELMAQAMRDVYEPLVKRQETEINKQNERIRDLENQVEALKKERKEMQEDFETRIRDLVKMVQANSNYPARGANGQFVKSSDN